jgi:hypothetical protein
MVGDKNMKNLIIKIKHWYWWNFKASEEEKCKYDIMIYGVRFMKDGKRINPKCLVNSNT